MPACGRPERTPWWIWGRTRSREGKWLPPPSDERLTARAAPALDERVAIRVVVVRQLLAAADRARRADPDASVLDVDVAVRLAGVIDEARDVAADARIDHRAVRQLEAPDVPALDVAPLAAQALLVGNF